MLWGMIAIIKHYTCVLRAVFSSIRMIPRGKTTEISVPSQPLIRFFPPVAQNRPLRPFLGPRGPKWRFHFWYLTQKEQRAGRAGCIQVTLFPYNCWVRKEKNAIRARFGGPRAETRFGKRPKTIEGHWEKLRCGAVYP